MCVWGKGGERGGGDGQIVLASAWRWSSNSTFLAFSSLYSPLSASLSLLRVFSLSLLYQHPTPPLFYAAASLFHIRFKCPFLVALLHPLYMRDAHSLSRSPPSPSISISKFCFLFLSAFFPLFLFLSALFTVITMIFIVYLWNSCCCSFFFLPLTLYVSSERAVYQLSHLLYRMASLALRSRAIFYPTLILENYSDVIRHRVPGYLIYHLPRA